MVCVAGVRGLDKCATSPYGRGMKKLQKCPTIPARPVTLLLPALSSVCCPVQDFMGHMRDKRGQTAVWRAGASLVSNQAELERGRQAASLLTVCCPAQDFKERIRHYEEVYETITDRSIHYIKLIDMVTGESWCGGGTNGSGAGHCKSCKVLLVTAPCSRRLRCDGPAMPGAAGQQCQGGCVGEGAEWEDVRVPARLLASTALPQGHPANIACMS